MNLKIPTVFFILALSILISGFFFASPAAAAELKQESDPREPAGKEEVPANTDILVPGDNEDATIMAPMDVTTLSTDFESTEGSPGFTPGYCAQNGWTAFAASTAQGQISSANPYFGSQNLRLARDTSVSRGTFVGCFSPDIGAQVIAPTWMEIEIAISNTGGADYFVVAQAPSQGYLTARVDFYYLGDILVLDDLGSDVQDVQWVDTGWNWTVGPHTSLRIEVDPAYSTIRYYYGGMLIYTGSVFAGTTIEQIVLFSDNYNSGDRADFDSLEVYVGSHPTSINLVSFESQGGSNLPAWIIPAVLAALLLPLTFMLRRQSPNLH